MNTESTAPHVPLSILDLVPLSEGMTMRDAITASMDTVRAADRLGYERYWFAEHHNTHNLASSATALLIDRAASLTERIRVGSGGIMLPNHAPLRVVEDFGTLIQFHGDRIDLGLGRAPGTDPVTAQFLARTSAEPAAFLQAVEQMRLWSSATPPQGLRVSADVAEGTEIPMWILGSTTNGAELAAQLGMPFAVASHFAPFQYLQALDRYRRTFQADAETAQIAAPRTMVGVNLVIAETDEEAQRQFSTLLQMFASVVTGARQPLQPPRTEAELATILDPAVRAKADQSLSIRAVGSPQSVVAQLERIVAATHADELILTAYTFDPADRVRGLELLADAWGARG
ncbi:LLM class flavin-dependent oxidoreductase [Brachybacterium nesterenkovii]|uniref:Coenzyme F420-dependent oxidoreductase n=1 Tax=Brachybacterium nesterenkovii TaxID=47847 RepID=A0A1X6X930_9MICO|nr:LLM class flavin-dependent oxidoreductase [Brachybacterium nesterenkovii]SLM95593.1 Coenzyme F420-dependent oxidoreductase [Brachybacterium nesterenkovii]